MRRALCAAGALALSACSVLHNPHAGPVADAWTQTRDRHTRVAKLYDRFETHALATATWQVAEVRAQRVDQVAVWKAMSAPERATLAVAEAAEAEQWDEFLLAFFTTESRDNDLDAKGSVWRVALVADGAQDRLPAEIKVVRSDTLLRDLFPYIHEYDTIYRVRFARAGPTGSAITLRIAGSEGQMDFRFGR